MLGLLQNFLVGAGVGTILIMSWYAGKGLWLLYKDLRAAKKNSKEKSDGVSLVAMSHPVEVEHNTMPKIRIGVIEAMNGRILEVSTAMPNNHGHYDWKTEMYVVPEEQKLSEAIALVMLMKGLEK